MPLRAELEGSLYAALRDLVKAAEVAGGIDLTNAKRALTAWEQHDPAALTVPSGPSAMLRPCPSEPSTHNRERVIDDGRSGTSVEGGEDSDVGIVYERFLSLIPTSSRVAKVPGKRATTLIKRSLKERPLEVVLAAVNGGAKFWGADSVKFRIERIFATWKNTGSLAERIDWLSSQDPTFAPQIAWLDLPGVRDRVHDAKREIRAALDMPGNDAFQKRALDAESWLRDNGNFILIADDGSFSIESLEQNPLAPPIFAVDVRAIDTEWREGGYRVPPRGTAARR